MKVRFSAALIEWRGPAPFFWLPLPEEAAEDVHEAAAWATYGWGAIPVRAQIGATEWETSLLPRDGGYMLPLKVAVRRAESIELGDRVDVVMTIERRHGRAAGGDGPTT